MRGDACAVAPELGEFDLAYLDPPYNQHRYEANYHIWETLVAWDAPDHYGVACKRTEIREGERSAFNSRRTMPDALAQVVRDVRARLLVLSYNDESWMGLDELIEICRVRGHVEVLAFASNRYVGARIGIHNPAGERVGSVGPPPQPRVRPRRRGSRRGPPCGRALARLAGGGPGELIVGRSGPLGPNRWLLGRCCVAA